MSETKEIGGYFGLECGSAPLMHENGIYLNLGRSALRYVIRVLGIKRMHIPYYTCHTVAASLRAEDCEPVFYKIGDDFLPDRDFPKEDFILYNNYFGVCGAKVDAMVARYPNLVIDNAQAYYSQYYSGNCGRAAIYSPRKFFGLPDGGILVGEGLPTLDLPQATSWQNMASLLKRIDINAQAGYEDFVKCDENMMDAPLLAMSKLTLALLRSINVKAAAERRRKNFAYLQQQLPTSFPLAMADDDVPMVYPYITDDMHLRAKLIKQKIFVASYWPEVHHCGDLQERILPLPIDQRYGEEEMKRIVNAVKE